MSLPTDYSLETHGPSYGTEESRASGRFTDRTLTPPEPAFAIDARDTFWRTDLTGYFVANARSGKRRGTVLGRAAFDRIEMKKPDRISREDVPFGQRPNGNWRRLVTGTYTSGQEVCYDHRIYGRCLLLATDGVHAIIETHERFEWRPNKYGQPIFTLVGERERMEVDFKSLTQLPQENIPLVRKRTCRSCDCKFTSLLDDCPECHEPYRKAAKRKAKSKVDSSVLDSIIDDLLS